MLLEWLDASVTRAGNQNSIAPDDYIAGMKAIRIRKTGVASLSGPEREVYFEQQATIAGNCQKSADGLHALSYQQF